VAPGRRTRRIVSRTNRCAPRLLLADPLRIRACRISPVSARVPQRVVAALAGVAEGRALLGVAVVWQIVESTSITSGAAPGPAPAAHAAVSSRSVNASS
jgi:hypothetical protein